MQKKIIHILMLLLPFATFAQEEAVTSSGKVVLLFPDSTWKLKPLALDTLANDSTQADTVLTQVPKKVEGPKTEKELTGFRGFLKPEMKLPALPVPSEGVYEFRVRVNQGRMGKRSDH